MTSVAVGADIVHGPTRSVAGYAVRPGRPLPFGASVVPGGVNFSIHSADAAAITLVLFARGGGEPIAELPIPPEFRIGGVHAILVLGLDPTVTDYGYRVGGRWDPDAGEYFDNRVVLLDPYAAAVTGRDVWRGTESGPEDAPPMRSRLVPEGFDWEGDVPLRRPSEDLVVYETHVRGFTRHRSSGVAAPGTFAGLIDKIPHLRDLGVNCVELMPVFEFDEWENSRRPPGADDWLVNYWGYATVGFFAPKAGLASAGADGGQVTEFKSLVRALHSAGIEVILDVVFNHTAEGNECGPVLSFRGLDNRTFYMLTDDGHYQNFSGTGNTVNGNHPTVRRFILDCLRYWVSEYHVDGFRFDLAAVLSRGPDGAPMSRPPLLDELAHDPVLQDCKLIAEAWDAGGLYQVGSFPDFCRWSEWNGRFRDVVRRFVKGDEGMAGPLATCMVGSPDLYGDRGPRASVNFVTAHDGFPLRDLVSYNDKHNEANGEDNRDGESSNDSWNCGAEGPTDDPVVLALRERQARTMLVLLLCSRGVPMLLAGDEMGRTQHGNNNAYCHDDELSWIDWGGVDENAALLRFVRLLIAFRADHPALRWPEFPDRPEAGAPGSVTWHGVVPGRPDFSAGSRLLAVTVHGDGDDVYLVANAHWEAHALDLPAPPPGRAWHLAVDTAAASPADIHAPGAEPRLDGPELRVADRSAVVLVARTDRC